MKLRGLKRDSIHFLKILVEHLPYASYGIRSIGNSDGKTLVLPSGSLCVVDDKENNYNMGRIQTLDEG